MSGWLLAALAGAAGFVLGALAAWRVASVRSGGLDEQIRGLRAAAEEEAQSRLREADLAAKEALLAAQEEQDAALDAARERLVAEERRLEARAMENVRRGEALDAQEQRAFAREAALEKGEARQRELRAELDAQRTALERELARVARLDRESARAELLESVMTEARCEAGRRILQLEAEAEAEADDRAAVLIATAAHRIAASFVAEKTVTVVALPSDDMKGRIIGREGRNIRALEAATGVDVVIDDTPEVVVLSGFSPLRREVARLALLRLVEDGRIHPARVEEVVDTVRDELEQELATHGEELARELGVSELPPALCRLLGSLRFHVASGQNLQSHASEVVTLAGAMACELSVDDRLARRAALLSCLGAVADHELGGNTLEAAAELARRHGQSAEVLAILRALAVGAPDTVVAVLVDVARQASRARPGARREPIQAYIERHEAMESIGRSFAGVTEAHAIQAGRELRVMVSVSKVDDAEALMLSRDIAGRIRQELTFPGEVRVTVVREARASEVAR